MKRKKEKLPKTNLNPIDTMTLKKVRTTFLGT